MANWTFLSFSRIRSILPVVAWLGASVLLVNIALHTLSATPLLAWMPKAVSGTGFLEDNRARVAAAADELKSANRQLAVIVGISNVREGINLSAVADAADDPAWQFLGLGGAGLGMPDIADHVSVLLNSELRPRLVVVGLGLHQLIDPKPAAAAANAADATKPPGIVDYLRRGDLRNLASSARASLWFFARRQDVAIAADKAALRVRESLLHAAGVHLPRPRDTANSPFREMIKSGWPDHFSDATLKEEEAFFERLGAFDSASYRDSAQAPRTLAALADAFEARKTHVVLLLMPDHPVLQRRIPADAGIALEHTLSFMKIAPAVLDFRRLVDDGEGFVDLAHLNRFGSQQLSVAMGRALRPILKQR